MSWYPGSPNRRRDDEDEIEELDEEEEQPEQVPAIKTIRPNPFFPPTEGAGRMTDVACIDE